MSGKQQSSSQPAISQEAATSLSTSYQSPRISGDAITGPDVRQLRVRARRRSWLCPGAGFALLGRGGLAVAAFFSALAMFGTMAWLALAPGAVALWRFLGFLAVALSFGVAEQFVGRKGEVRHPQPSFLAGGLLFSAMAFWAVLGSACFLTVTAFGHLRMEGSGMSPTLDLGEHFIYHRSVDASQLKPGTVILFRLSGRSAWTHPGAVVISRILAEPGDRLSIRGKTYLINGEPGPAVADTKPYQPMVQVPRAPDSITVPAECYFIVQDSPQASYDSRVLSWVKGDEIVSTRMYYLSDRGLFAPVK